MAHIQFFISNLMVYKSIIVESLNAFTGDVNISCFKFTGCYNPPPPPFTNLNEIRFKTSHYWIW